MPLKLKWNQISDRMYTYHIQRNAIVLLVAVVDRDKRYNGKWEIQFNGNFYSRDKAVYYDTASQAMWACEQLAESVAKRLLSKLGIEVN